MSSNQLLAVFAEWWTPQTSQLIAAIAVGSLLVWWRSPESRPTLRKTVLLILVSTMALLLLRALETPAADGPFKLGHGILILVIGAMVIRLAGMVLFKVVFDVLRIRPPSILEEILVVLAWFAWAMLQLGDAGVSLGEILTTSAIATAVLAFSMQDTLGNILGGLALQWDHSLKVGDWIRLGDVEGKIVDIRWRAIIMETRNWETVVIPNGEMMRNRFKVLGQRSGEDRKWRRWVWFSVDYSCRPEEVIAWVEAAVSSARIPCVEDSPKPSCVLMEMDGSVGRYALRYWLSDMALDDPTDSLVRQHIYAALNRNAVRLAMPKQHLYLTNKDESYLERKSESEFERRRQALAKIDLFAVLEADEIDELAGKLEYRPYASGDTVFRKGEEDHFLYAISTGRAAEYADDALTPTLFLNPGDIFGAHGLMTGKPREATVRAESALECYAIGKAAINDILLRREDLVEEISRVLAEHLEARRAVDSRPQQSTEASAHSVRELVAGIRRFMGLGRADD